MASLFNTHMPEPATQPPIRPIFSLRARDVAALSAGLPAGWTIERHECCDGDLLVLLVPADAAAATYVVCRDREGLRVSRNSGDELQPLGRFATAADVLAAIQAGTPA